jgi:hypothetical protein
MRWVWVLFEWILLMCAFGFFFGASARSTPTSSLWDHRQSGIDAARGWSSEVTSCGRSDLK